MSVSVSRSNPSHLRYHLLEIIRRRRGRRIQGDPQRAQEIALAPEFLLKES
jgi:hypothetical protein